MADETEITIHHNPRCGTSRNVLRLIEAAGYHPKVVDYLKTGWTKMQLVTLFEAAGLRPRDALRIKGTPAAELGLTDPKATDTEILEAMLENPILVERPFVVTAKGVKLCRPSEAVLDLLDRWPTGPFAKEDGELIIDAEGRRVR